MAGFGFIAGALCLDFVNTVGGRAGRRVLNDKIVTAADLPAWADLAGLHLSRKQRERTVSAGAVERAHELREALYRVLFAGMRGKRPPPGDLRKVQEEIHSARVAQRLVQSAAGYRWMAEPASDAAAEVLRAVADSAAELLTSVALSRLRQCGGPQCGWLFLDATRNRSRRWCDMKDCGNRAKVRRYRERHL